MAFSNGWDEDDLKAVRAHHRNLFYTLKRDHGCIGGRGSLVRIPGFIEAVDGMLRDGWTLTDISAIFGVSRERVRQWKTTYQLPDPLEPGTSSRRWDPEQARFVPVLLETVRAEERARVERRKARRRKVTRLRRTRRRREMVASLQAAAEALGRVPALTEFARFLGKEDTSALSVQIAYDWRKKSDGGGYAPALNRMWRAAGFKRPFLHGPNAWPKEEILEALGRFRLEEGRWPRVDDWGNGLPCYATVCRAFGSMEVACRKVAIRFDLEPPGISREWSRSEVVSSFQRFASEFGRGPRIADLVAGVRPHYMPSASTVHKHVGGMSAACEAAGVPDGSNEIRRRILQGVIRYRSEVGRAPSCADLRPERRPEYLASYEQIHSAFGGLKALKVSLASLDREDE